MIKVVVALLFVSLVLKIDKLIAVDIFIFKNNTEKNKAKKKTINFQNIFLCFLIYLCKDITNIIPLQQINVN